MVDIVPVKNLTAKTICDALLQIFARWQIPSVFISDNATCFTSHLSDEFRKIFGVSPRFSSPLRPLGNGLAERMVQNVKNCLHHVLIKFGHEWHLQLPFIVWALREMPNATTGISPNMLVFGKHLRGPLALLKDIWSQDFEISKSMPKSISGYLFELQQKLKLAAEIAEANTENKQQAYTSHYNKHAKMKKFEIGDKVLVFEKDSSTKILSRWIGPCTILK